MTGRIIRTDACVAEGAADLAARCPRMAHALAVSGPLPLRRRPDGFAELAAVVLGQQVSVASAEAVRARLEAAGLMAPGAVLRARDTELRAAGLSRQKARYLREIARADIDFAALRDAPDAEVVARLTRVPGIGPWTAEIYGMFSLGRADMFAPGDLALQEAARMLYDLPARPGAPALRAMAAAWSPWRSVAARILWAYYLRAKDREGIR